MASGYDNPADYLAWFIRGDKLAILTNKSATNSNVDGDWVAIDESVSDSILINYTAEPDAITSVSSTPDLDNSMHPAMVDFIKSKLYLDEAGKKGLNVEERAFNERMSNHHEGLWEKAIKKYGSYKRNKVGGSRVMIGRDFK